MSTPINDGGPAFPATTEDDRDCGPRYIGGYGGMSLRDYFAAKAMQALLTLHNEIEGDALGRYSYASADAMLVVRKTNTSISRRDANNAAKGDGK